MKEFKVITMDAKTSYERGVQYGTQARDEIETAISFYKKKFEDEYNYDEIIKYTQGFYEEIKRFSNEISDELQGIADGSKHDIKEIILVNARYELSQFNWQHECTTGVYLNKTKGKNYIFKNCDLGGVVGKHLVILHTIRQDGFRALGIAEAGQLIRDGYNNHGLALVNSALRSNKDYGGIAVPGTVIRKKVWESTDFNEAIALQRNIFRTVSTNMLIADKNGNVIDFECYPGGQDEVVPVGGIVSTGNRFTVNKGLNRIDDPSLDRGKHLRTLLEEYKDDIDEYKIMKILKDHTGYPGSICRHVQNGPNTVYSIIVNMTDDKIFICKGHPCESEYKEYNL